jgi:hypothetical protein
LRLRLQVQLRKQGGALNDSLGMRLDDTGGGDREIAVVVLRPEDEI